MPKTPSKNKASKHQTEGLPERKCLVLGEVQPKAELLRFVLGPEDQVVPDLDEQLPGRGFWLSARRDVVETAIMRKAFHRGARRTVTVQDDLADLVGRLLLKRCQDGLGLARRSGKAVCGFDKVSAAIGDRSGYLIEASDGKPDGRKKIAARVKQELELRSEKMVQFVAEALTAEQLGLPFARERAVHVWVDACPLGKRIARDMARYASYCETEDEQASIVAR